MTARAAFWIAAYRNGALAGILALTLAATARAAELRVAEGPASAAPAAGSGSEASDHAPLVAPLRAAPELLDRVDRALVLATPGGLFRTELSVLFDLEAYYIDQRPPGLIFGGGDSFVNPRLSLFLDTHLGRHLYSLVQARIDRGFDPRERSSSARFDEYLLRWTPVDARLNLQVGKFATVVGNWVARHDSWQNPFINAPLPYENITAMADYAAPDDAHPFLALRTLPDRKREWVPIIWGPSYTSGAAVFGRVSDVDYAVEVKNAALSSRPDVWDARNRGWNDPTVSGRLGWRPAPAWSVGASASRGAFLRQKARATLPAGRDIDDYAEELLGLDMSYAWRHWQLWAELFLTRFEVPRVGDADVASYYLESRYKITPKLFAGLRWNQQVFGDVENPAGHGRAWDHDMWRVDVVTGYRFDRHLQAKLQYAYSHQLGDRQQGEQLVALQLTLKF